MPHLYRLGTPGVTSISHNGVEHRVNADGLLEVDEAHMTPGLHKELVGHYSGGLHDDSADSPLQNADEEERQILFARLDTALARRVDRRKSLEQLREMLADHEARQRRTAGASQAFSTAPGTP